MHQRQAPPDPTLVIGPQEEERSRSLEVGAILGEYQVLKLLGEGAMGRVYLVRHLILGQEYALKILLGSGARPVREERFRREAQATARITHPNVVRVHYSGLTEDAQIYLVMEHLTGRPLSDLLERGSLEPRRAAHIARQIAEGLQAIHELGLVHRDIKPSNIMIEDEGGADLVKILDLGLVGFMDAEPDVRLTQQGHLMGTPLYMAPEALSNAQFSPQTDLYALGVVLYELLSGQAPFDGTLKEIFWHHHVTQPPALLFSHGLDELAYRLLEKLPERRPQSAAEVVEEIDRRLAKSSTALQIEGLSTRTRRAVLRRFSPKLGGGPDWTLRLAVAATVAVSLAILSWALFQRPAEVQSLVEAGPVTAPLERNQAPAFHAPQAPTAAPEAPAPAATPPAPSAAAGGEGAAAPAPRNRSASASSRRDRRAPASGPVELLITSDPPGAIVETAAGRLGLTPLSAAVDGGHSTTFTISKDGYRAGRLVYSTKSRSTRLHARLRPQSPP